MQATSLAIPRLAHQRLSRSRSRQAWHTAGHGHLRTPTSFWGTAHTAGTCPRWVTLHRSGTAGVSLGQTIPSSRRGMTEVSGQQNVTLK